MKRSVVILLLLCTFIWAAGGVAVLPFSKTGEGPDQGQEIADHLMSFIAQSGFVTVVDRSSIAQIMQEIQFGMSGMVDDATAVEAGKLVGAEKIIVGSYSSANGFFKIQARIVNVATGVVEAASIKEGKKASETMDMAAVGLLDQMGVKATYNSSYKVKRGVGFTALGVSAATLGAGIYSQIRFGQIQDEQKKLLSQDEYKLLEDEGTFHKNARFYFWGTSAVSAGLGVIMLLTADSEWQFEQKKTKMAVAPYFDGDRFGAVVQVVF